MILHHKHYPGPPGSPLLILHGLYGNQGNWAPQARELARDHDVFVLDARNHGLSAWAPSLRLQDMADDVTDTMDSLGLARAHLLGHSMGGKTAMLLALTRPQRVCSVCSVDIAPVVYPQAATTVIDALVDLDLAGIASRSDADRQLSARITEKSVRDFLLTNLLRTESGAWRWRFNLPVLAASFAEVTGWPDGLGAYAGPALFIKGQRSDYILPAHEPALRAQFPQARLEVVEEAGHWVHSERAETVVQLIRQFLGALPAC